MQKDFLFIQQQDECKCVKQCAFAFTSFIIYRQLGIMTKHNQFFTTWPLLITRVVIRGSCNCYRKTLRKFNLSVKKRFYVNDDEHDVNVAKSQSTNEQTNYHFYMYVMMSTHWRKIQHSLQLSKTCIHMFNITESLSLWVGLFAFACNNLVWTEESQKGKKPTSYHTIQKCLCRGGCRREE